MSGDIISEINFFKILDFHYIKRSSLTLVYEKVEKTKEKNPKLKPFQSEANPERFIHMLEEGTNRLLGTIDPYDLSEIGIKMKTSILARHPQIAFSNDLQEKYVAICSRDICKILAELGKNFNNFYEDFQTFLAHNQYNKKLLRIIKSDSEPATEVAKFYAKIFENESDFFRPFIYVTSDFSMRVKTLYDFHQANLIKVNKGGELTIYKETANDVHSGHTIEIVKDESVEAIQTPPQPQPVQAEPQPQPVSANTLDESQSTTASDKPQKKEKPAKGDNQNKPDEAPTAQAKAEKPGKKEKQGDGQKGGKQEAGQAATAAPQQGQKKDAKDKK